MARLTTIFFALCFALGVSVSSQNLTPEDINSKLTKAGEIGTALEAFLESIAKDPKDIKDFGFAQNAIQKLLPFVKNLGPLFALAATFFEQKNEALEELKKQFKIVNGHLESISLAVKKLRQDMFVLDIDRWYSDTVAPISQVESNIEQCLNATKEEEEHRRSELREECGDSKPDNFMVAVDLEILKSHKNENFRKIVSADYDKRKILNWIKIIAFDAARAMSAHQFCLGVNPTAKANLQDISSKDADKAAGLLTSVLGELSKDVDRVIKEWETGWKADVDNLPVNGLSQALAVKTQEELNAKYDWALFNAYFIEGSYSKKIFNEQRVRERSDSDGLKTIVVVWLYKKDVDAAKQNQLSQVVNYVKGVSCKPLCTTWRFDPVADKLKNEGATAVFMKDTRSDKAKPSNLYAIVPKFLREEVCHICHTRGAPPRRYIRALMVGF